MKIESRLGMGMAALMLIGLYYLPFWSISMSAPQYPEGIGGLIDFYMWGHDYGHNLSPDAPIKVPGMSYQPPLLGCKQLLNINACSWPYTGSIFIGLSMIFAGSVLYYEKTKSYLKAK